MSWRVFILHLPALNALIEPSPPYHLKVGLFSATVGSQHDAEPDWKSLYYHSVALSEEKLRKKDERLEKKDERLCKQHERMADLYQRLRQQQKHAHATEELLRDRDTRVLELEERCTRQSVRIEELSRLIHDTDGQMSALQAQLNRKMEEYGALKNCVRADRLQLLISRNVTTLRQLLEFVIVKHMGDMERETQRTYVLHDELLLDKLRSEPDILSELSASEMESGAFGDKMAESFSSLYDRVCLLERSDSGSNPLRQVGSEFDFRPTSYVLSKTELLLMYHFFDTLAYPVQDPRSTLNE